MRQGSGKPCQIWADQSRTRTACGWERQAARRDRWGEEGRL